MSLRTVLIVPVLSLLLLIAACSREEREWRSAQAADTIEAYGRFLEEHPEGEHAPEARTRVEQLAEERDWKRASESDSQAAYRQFVSQYPNGKWTQEARIRAENFALSEQPTESATDDSRAQTPEATASAPASAATQTNGSSPSMTHPAPAAPSGAPGPSSAMPEPRAAPVPRAADRALDSFAIQLGAFSSEAKARSEWQRLASRFDVQLGGLRPQVDTATTAAGRLYRLQAGVETEQQARNICAMLRQAGQGCVVVLPSPR